MSDLPPTVRQMFAEANDPADNLVRVIYRLSFAENGLVLWNKKGYPRPIKRTQYVVNVAIWWAGDGLKLRPGKRHARSLILR